MWAGSITISLCLILLVLLSLISVSLYSARIAAGRAALACAEEQGLYSMLSQYDRTLYEKYGLLFLDAGYGQRNLQLGRVLKQTRQDVSLVLHPNQEALALGSVDLLRFGAVRGEITGYVLATDGGGAAFQRQVCEVMQSSLGAALLETAGEHLQNESGIASRQREDSGKITESRAQEYYAEDHPEGSSAGERVVPENFVNPIESIQNLQKKGLLSLVIPDGKEISAFSRDLSDAVSRRDLQTGMGLVPSGWKEGGENLLLREFLVRKFPCYTSAEKEMGFQYQVEYALSGKASDKENLQATVRNIQKIRERSNLLYLMSSPARRAEASEAASVICAALACPELEPIVSLTLKKCWAWGESILDLRELLDGGKIPLVKTDSSWQLDLSSLADLMEKSEQLRHSSADGLDYEEYLRMLLLKKREDTLTGRMMDLTEWNVRQSVAGGNFCLDCCLDEAGVEISAEIGKQELHIERCCGYREQRKGLF